jgi:hypothetical protein
MSNAESAPRVKAILDFFITLVLDAGRPIHPYDASGKCHAPARPHVPMNSSQDWICNNLREFPSKTQIVVNGRVLGGDSNLTLPLRPNDMTPRRGKRFLDNQL